MQKTDCIDHLNNILSFLCDNSDCFNTISNELDISERELEKVLNSIILDIENEEI